MRAYAIAIWSGLAAGALALTLNGAGSAREGRQHLKLGACELHLEVAKTAEAARFGLSGRTHLPARTGMVFDIRNSDGGFWMKDTPLALSIVFLSARGTLVDQAELIPNDLQIVSPRVEAAFAIEAPRGTFQTCGVRPGDQVDIARIARMFQ